MYEKKWGVFFPEKNLFLENHIPRKKRWITCPWKKNQQPPEPLSKKKRKKEIKSKGKGKEEGTKW
jgi:hypothetical protein